MIYNLTRYKIGQRVVIRRNDWSITYSSVGVEILDKAYKTIKVRFLTDGWTKRGAIEWLPATDWHVVARIIYDLSGKYK